MKHLMDVNLLLAAIWENHSQHERAFRWLEGKKLAVCPLAELGFIRVSTNPKVINAPMAKTRVLLKNFLDDRAVERLSDDVPALDSKPQKSEQVTDSYLATLADRHGMKLATLDGNIKHPAVVLVGQ
jgi:hypothetical protein